MNLIRIGILLVLVLVWMETTIGYGAEIVLNAAEDEVNNATKSYPVARQDSLIAIGISIWIGAVVAGFAVGHGYIVYLHLSNPRFYREGQNCRDSGECPYGMCCRTGNDGAECAGKRGCIWSGLYQPSYHLQWEMEYNASSWYDGYSGDYKAEKAVTPRWYWCSKEYATQPQYWWITLPKPVEIVSIAFEEGYGAGGQYELLASNKSDCATNGKSLMLIKGTRDEINEKPFENGRSYSCYGFKITHDSYATVKDFQFFYKRPEGKHSCCFEDSCKSYRGNVSTTISGGTCQRWDVHEPHSHDLHTAITNPDSGLEENYCRNPSDEPFAWCYTTGEKRMEHCDVCRGGVIDSRDWVKPAITIRASNQQPTQIKDWSIAVKKQGIQGKCSRIDVFCGKDFHGCDHKNKTCGNLKNLLKPDNSVNKTQLKTLEDYEEHAEARRQLPICKYNYVTDEFCCIECPRPNTTTTNTTNTTVAADLKLGKAIANNVLEHNRHMNP